MPTRSNDAGTSDMVPRKKQKLGNEPQNLSFAHVLLECGVTSFDRGSDSNQDTNTKNKVGCLLDQGVTPSSLRASIQALLSEMHKNGKDVDNLTILASMEEFISSGTMADADTNDSEDEASRSILLWKMLLPMHSKHNADVDPTTENPKSSQNVLEEIPKTVNFDASLIKVLLRVDALQSSLLTTLLSKLQEISMAQSDMENILNADLEVYACNEEIPRLIVSHIRWLELTVDPITLINASLECIIVLSTNLPEDQSGSGGGKGENPTRAILLDLISTLPEIIDDFATHDLELMENVTSTLRDIRLQDPTMLIPCLDAVSSLKFTETERVILDALDAMESITESWILPALTKFLVQNVPRKNADILKKVIESFRRMRLGHDDGDDAQTNSDRGQVHEKTDSQALMLEALSQGFSYRMDLTNMLLNSVKETTHLQHGSADLWLLMCCAVAAHNKPKVNQLLKKISGSLTDALLIDTIKGNGAALDNLFDSSILPMADALVRSNEQSARSLGARLYEEIFLEFTDRVKRQEIVGQLVIHVASGQSYQEIDVALKVFSNIVVDSSNGAENLRVYMPFLTSLLDNVQNFQPSHLRRLFLLVFIVGGAEEDSKDGGSIDELQIMIHKFLATQNAAKQIVSSQICQQGNIET